MPPTDEHREVSSDIRSPFYRPDGGSSRRSGAVAPGDDGRVSGELEGSTLGRHSQDGERKATGQRRTQSSGGFLVDSYSLPRAKSLRFSSHLSRPSEPITEKRSAPGGDIVVPKKRSRLPWHHHKNNASESASGDLTPSSVASQQQHPPPGAPQPRASSATENGARQQETPGFDRDSMKIVNLALNLNESRRRAASGLPAGSTDRRPISMDLHGSSPGGNRSQDFRNYSQVQGEDSSQWPQQGGQSPIMDLLPATAMDSSRAFEFSQGTLARAERARRHFDLFNEYLRLLPMLPPLRTPRVKDASDSPQASAATLPTYRAYNPLQMIRNRRTRYREKCSFDAEAEGWNDAKKVHEWVNSVQDKYSNKTHGHMESISLPPFQHDRRLQSQGEAMDVGGDVSSPPSSLRRESRTHNVKAARPRLDWKFSPAELLADAAWLEAGVNKAKIADSNGNKLYSDPKELALMDTDPVTAAPHKRAWSVDTEDAVEERLSPRTSLSSSRPAMAHEFQSVGRGRHRHKLRGHSPNLRDRSTSGSRKPSRWDKMKMRAGSVSSGSSAERRTSVDQKHHWTHSRKSSERLSPKATMISPEARASRSKSPAAMMLNLDKDKFQKAELPSISTRSSQVYRKASISSAGSMDDRYCPRMSLEGMDSTAPSSPVQAAYFPSIAANLSPPSSRSPSPAKKGLRQKITSRHERSKSEQGDRGAREYEAEVMDPGDLPSSTEGGEHAPKLEPSPLPDVVSSSHADEYGTGDDHRVDGSRGRKGQHLPESKLRGIFKGPGRIAEFVGNEVSRVGDLILKNHTPVESRKSSSATDLASDESDADDEERRRDKRSGPKALLRRLPTMADEPGRPPRPVRRETDRGTSSRGFMGTLPTFTSPLRQDDRTDSTDMAEWGSPRERSPASKRYDDRDDAKRMTLPRSKTFDFHHVGHSGRGRAKPHGIKDPSVPFSLTRPPVTGLAQARASPGPSAEKRPPLAGAHRTWSISDRSVQTVNDSGVPSKTEIERTRTLFLSSGIKAREITRRAHSVRDPPPHWLQSSLGPKASSPRVTRINEFDVAAENLLRRFETTQYSFQQSMHQFTTTTSSPIRSQLKELERLVNHTLNPRVRATADDAEELCVQLNTTSTLAVKSLSDALDKGLRNRRRRLRWVRRAGFVVLEWALVGMLWWVWLIVMAFKLVRGILRGALSSARWVLWL